MKIDLKKTPEYEELIEELKTIAGTFLPEIQRLDIDQHWYAGRMISTSKFYKLYGAQGLNLIVKARGFSLTTVRREVKFYETFPDIEVTPGVLNYTPIEAKITSRAFLSWRIIHNEILVNERREKKSQVPEIKEIDASAVRYLVDATKASYITVMDEGFKKIRTLRIKHAKEKS